MTVDDIRRAAQAGAGIVRETPVLSSRTLSERAGGTVVLKAENLQRTGSFKIRGALAKLAALGDGCAAGVITASAGNHGQALAYAARARGVPCEVFMPETASISKVEAASALGATVHLLGATVEESLGAARERVPSGVAVGIIGSVGRLLDAVAAYVDQGYLRIKKAGGWMRWSAKPVSAIPNFFVFLTAADTLRMG